MRFFNEINRTIALLIGSALFVYSCGDGKKNADSNILRPTMISHNLTISHYENGKLQYKFDTPYLVQYENKDTSYMIFDKGVHIVTYNDSTGEIKSWLKAKYAVYRKSIEQWEARDSVVAYDITGKTLYTDLLFWEQKEKRIYSTIETKVISGDESVVGLNGFESDDDMSNIQFFKSKGRILVDTTTNEPLVVDTLTTQ